MPLFCRSCAYAAPLMDMAPIVTDEIVFKNCLQLFDDPENAGCRAV
jgi:hypothetical protein